MKRIKIPDKDLSTDLPAAIEDSQFKLFASKNLSNQQEEEAATESNANCDIGKKGQRQSSVAEETEEFCSGNLEGKGQKASLADKGPTFAHSLDRQCTNSEREVKKLWKKQHDSVAPDTKLILEKSVSSAVVRAGGGAGGNAIGVSRRQNGNPIFKYLRNVPYEFADTVADFDLGSGCCVVYLSLKFHRRHPDYITTRFKEIGHAYALQVLLVLCDMEESEQRLRELNQMCVFGGWSVIVAFSQEEAAEYLESYKIYEHKSADLLHGVDSTGLTSLSGKKHTQKLLDKERAVDLLACIRSVSRTDARQLLDTFGSLKNISDATVDQLNLCPGFGAQKASRVYRAIRAPFFAEKGAESRNSDEEDISL